MSTELAFRGLVTLKEYAVIVVLRDVSYFEKSVIQLSKERTRI